ncbi:MAG: iron-containing alcohol dehydrogenase [Anaerolineae bacterium]|nr:iron-containing alcohol dehydrogenase [Anaerolineae bacterium]
MTDFMKARRLLTAFKGGRYIHGLGVLAKVGQVTAPLGRRAALIRSGFPGSDGFVWTIRQSLEEADVAIVGSIDSPAPNVPIEDLMRITKGLRALEPEVVVSFGGGSNIDAAKAAILLHDLGGNIEDYFGAGLVTKAIAEQGRSLTPHVAIQTVASSAAHLTKYSNITNAATGQKKLIVDDAIVPQQPIFDYTATFSAPLSLTADGAMDGISHSLEVLYGAVGKDNYVQIEAVAAETIRLVVTYLPRVMQNPADVLGREALGLATDLGGYAIMLGGTNGGHLTSFSLVDVMPHGRACALMNPYYTVFFAPAIERPLKVVGGILRDAGYVQADVDRLQGRALGEAVAEAMIAFNAAMGLPTTLLETEAFTDAHITRALTAAKNPQLKMKLENMPVPLTADMVDEYMGAVLQAARDGDLSLIKNV